MGISRRDQIKGVKDALIGTAAGSARLLVGRRAVFAQGGIPGGGRAAPERPWPYKRPEVRVVAKNAYGAYDKGGYCYGVFETVIGALRSEIGAPYQTFPTHLTIFGEGGKTICAG
jgi:hypothetical protein